MKTIAFSLLFFMGGFFLQAQELKDRNRNYMGEIKKDGTVTDHRGDYTGEVKSDGTVTDHRGNYLGKIKSDGTVVDHMGNYLGNAKGVDKNKVALIYFFSKP